MGQIVLGSISRQRFSTWLMTAFGAAALLLATLGIYGLIAHSVRQRRREIGIRIALGAESAQVRTMMVREGLVLTAAGLGAGLLGAFWLTRLATPWLYGVTSSDPVTFIAVPAAVGTAALLAIWLPSRRASGVDPSVALRSE